MLQVMYKLFSEIICNKLQRQLYPAQKREHAGIRSGLSTIDHLQAIRKISSGTVEHKVPSMLGYIDFEKTLDYIYFKAILEALKGQGMENP